MHADGPVRLRIEPVAPGDRVDIAIERKPDDTTGGVDHGAPGVTANDIVGGDEVGASLRIQPALRVEPRFRKREWWCPCRSRVQSIETCERVNPAACLGP